MISKQRFFYATLLSAFILSCSQSPSTPEEYLAQGDAQLERGDLSSAVESYRLALHQDTLNPVILARLAQAYRKQKKFDAADNFFYRAIDIPFSAGVEALKSGDDSTAFASFQRTLEIYPQHPLALAKLGDILLARGQDDEALRHFQKSSEANPELADTWVKLGRLYAQKKQTEQAKAAFNKAIQMNINSFRSYLGLGQIYLEEKNWLLAADQFDKALQVNPQSQAARDGLQQARQNF